MGRLYAWVKRELAWWKFKQEMAAKRLTLEFAGRRESRR